MEARVLRCPLVWAVLLLSGTATGQQCTPLVLCPAILRDPASHLVGTRAACPLADGSNGVLCPTDVIDRSPGHGGYDYRYRPMPQQNRFRSQIPLPRRLTRPEEVILKMLYPDVVQRLLNTADFLLRSREQRAAQLTAQGSNVALTNSAEQLQLLFSRPVLQTTVVLGREGEKNSILLQEASRIGAVFSGRALQPPLANHQSFSLPDPPAELLQAAVRPNTPGCASPAPPSCGGNTDRFRTHDGTCNNQQRPRQGSAHTVYERFFPSRVGESNTADSLDVFRTIGLTLFGQFVDHDLTATPEFALENTSIDEAGEGGGFSCCNRDHSFPAMSLHPLACIPIRVPADDPVFGPQGVRCMSQVRSLVGGNEDCVPRPAAQQNQITHYLDGSNIYGSSDEESTRLRLRVGGRMRTLQPGNLLARDSGRCSTHPDDCFISGDHRVGENIGLAYEHLVWTREHNRVAAALAVRHPDYDDERLYQEARRIVIGEYQHIVFNEWLPTILGYGYTQAAGLAPGSSPGYSPEARGVIANEFSTAAFRFAHSMVHDVFELESQAIALERTFFNSSFLLQFGLVREVARSLTTQRPGWVDRAFSSALRERLFIRPGMPGLDLVALNINRGREHGLQPYITAVENCQGRTIASWEDLADLMEPETIARLRGVYDSVEDVDLFIGVVSERRARNAAVGRTLQCLIGQQFIDLRDGDRFFYEHTGLPNSFTPAQLAELRRSSLARVYCDNVPGLDHIQPLAFFQPQFFSNGRQSCETLAIPTPDLSVF
ncbi:Peroxidase [Amphibalanus amphitrite]|uniref:Peroxidase n=1 Tax=Amphibalanus amphitrite TaxID=1232801 RepID=A0A6A4WKZ1_AMPAM|nr:Peroxidase [Amphibalanus amphitrite]